MSTHEKTPCTIQNHTIDWLLTGQELVYYTQQNHREATNEKNSRTIHTPHHGEVTHEQN